MASYDSDSSFEDDGNYTETNVMLGYASEEPTDDAFSQLGGHATWLSDGFPPSARLARCKVCKDMMALLLQLNGDLPKQFPGHERRIYLYTCRKKQCRRKEGSVRGFRATRIAKGANTQIQKAKQPEAPAIQPPTRSVGLGTQLFGGSGVPGASNMSNPFSMGQLSASANPFGMPASQQIGSQSSPCEPSQPSTAPVTDPAQELSETYASKLSLGMSSTNGHTEEPIEPWPDSAALPQPYTKHYLDADYETLSAEEDNSTATKSKVTEMEIDGESSAAPGGNSADDKELFESSMDKTFQRFADRLRHNPEQILRYEFDGTPLLYSSADAIGKRLHVHDHVSSGAKVVSSGAKGFPMCPNCGAKRKFELQLTPHAIEMLEADEPASAILDGMDWGTILLAVCERDCAAKGVDEGQIGYVEEWVGVQWEELAERPSTASGSK